MLKSILSIAIPFMLASNVSSETNSSSDEIQQTTGAKRFVFFENIVDKQEVYVQQQILLNVRLYRAKNPPNIELSEPVVENSIVEKIRGDKLFTEEIGGTHYLVREKSYAIFPQQSGTFNIINRLKTPNDKTILRHTVENHALDGELPASTFTEKISLKVNPQPTITSGAWLPSPEVLLTDNWIPPSNLLVVGKPATWTLMLSAQGLSENQLPNIILPEVDGLQFYPKVSKTRDINDRGVFGQRTAKVMIIPTKVGLFEVPQVQIKWWNTRLNTAEVAFIPRKIVTVVAESAL